MVLREHARDHLVIAGGGGMLDRLEGHPARVASRPPSDGCPRPSRIAACARAYSAKSECIRNQPPRPSLSTNRFARWSSASRARESDRSRTSSLSSDPETPQHREAPGGTSNVVAQRGENLVAEVVRHEQVLPPNVAHRRGRVLDRPQPEAGKDERCRPSLGLRTRSLISSAPRSDSPALTSNSSASRSVNARSSPAARNERLTRNVPRPGRILSADRDDVRVRRGGGSARGRAKPAWALVSHAVVEHQHERPAEAASPFISSSTASETEPPGELSLCNEVRPSPGRTRSTAVAT